MRPSRVVLHKPICVFGGEASLVYRAGRARILRRLSERYYYYHEGGDTLFVYFGIICCYFVDNIIVIICTIFDAIRLFIIAIIYLFVFVRWCLQSV